jgi:hypothetical protein
MLVKLVFEKEIIGNQFTDNYKESVDIENLLSSCVPNFRTVEFVAVQKNDDRSNNTRMGLNISALHSFSNA